jgi:hypothetical protein
MPPTPSSRQSAARPMSNRPSKRTLAFTAAVRAYEIVSERPSDPPASPRGGLRSDWRHPPGSAPARPWPEQVRCARRLGVIEGDAVSSPSRARMPLRHTPRHRTRKRFRAGACTDHASSSIGRADNAFRKGRIPGEWPLLRCAFEVFRFTRINWSGRVSGCRAGRARQRDTAQCRAPTTSAGRRYRA